MKASSLFAHYLRALNPSRRRTGPSRWQDVREIVAFLLGGFIFAAVLYGIALATMSVGSLAEPVTSHQSPITARP